jgi:predicted GNAT family N-acyltransferase
LAAIARLRYELFVERDGKAYAHADHSTRRFLEPIDEDSINFAVLDGDECAMAVRLSPASAAARDPHFAPAIERVRAVGVSLETLVVVSRLVNRETRRTASLIRELFRDVCRIACLAGGSRCLACARADLVPLFELFGFVATGEHVSDAIAGRLELLLLDPYDVGHLTRCRSPLLPVYRELCATRGEIQLPTKEEVA